jgi:hypothetical protein
MTMAVDPVLVHDGDGEHPVRYDLVPVAYMRDGVERHIEQGAPTGHFLYSMLSNDLFDAVARADTANLAALRDWMLWFHAYAPSRSYGSPTAVAEWREARQAAFAAAARPLEPAERDA